jgi:O-antigen/teichoic acid export membrane protein
MLYKRSIKEKLLKGGAWAFSGKLATAFTGLAANALLARLLTPEEMGAYFLTFSLVSVAAIIAQLGLTQAIVRLVAESLGTDRSARARLAVHWVVRIAGFGALLMSCALAFGGGAWVASRLFHSEIMSQVMGLAAVWVVIITFQQLMAEIFRGFHDIRLATVFGGLITGLLAMLMFLGLWLLQGYGDIHHIILLTLIAGFSSIALSSVLLWKKLSLLPWPSDEEISGLEIISISWPLWVTNLTIFVLVHVDLWIMGMFRSPEEVAVYGAALRMVTLITMPLLIVNAVVPPLIAEMHAQGKIKELEVVLRTAASLTGFPSLIVLGAFVFFGDSILGILFGEYYKVGGIVLAVLSIGQLANVWAGSCGLVLMLTGHQTAMMIITVCCGLFTAILGWELVSQYGGVGVAIAASSGMVLQNLSMLFFAKKSTGIWTHMDPLMISEFRRIIR